MEIIFLFCLYYLSQHPDFPQTMKPLLSSLKNSEEALRFLNELSHFSEMFSLFNPKKGETPSQQNSSSPPQQPDHTPTKPQNPTTTTTENNQEKNSSTATQGIADEFIERCLQNYFKNR